MRGVRDVWMGLAGGGDGDLTGGSALGLRRIGSGNQQPISIIVPMAENATRECSLVIFMINNILVHMSDTNTTVRYNYLNNPIQSIGI